MGNTTFYGPGQSFSVDTSKPFTVITQFIGSPVIKEIRRFYRQNGRLIPNAMSNIPGASGNSITPAFCDKQKAAFKDLDESGSYGFKEKGGFESMSKAARKGMVLVLSLWDDMYAHMNWLDSTWPLEGENLGRVRGSCNNDAGTPSSLRKSSPSAKVTFGNIRYGPIGSTWSDSPAA
jgi:cellulose 1,4-beta-cellobiosidase